MKKYLFMLIAVAAAGCCAAEPAKNPAELYRENLELRKKLTETKAAWADAANTAKIAKREKNNLEKVIAQQEKSLAGIKSK